jgi:hypothetical protein
VGRNSDVFVRGDRLRLRGLAAVAAAALTLIAACGGGGGEGDAPALPGLPQPPAPPPGTVSPPSIVSFTPDAGATGTQVTISGLNFATPASANTVRFNGVDAAVLSASPTTVVAAVPAGATSGSVQVVTSGGTATSGATFTVLSGSGPGAAWQTRSFGTHVGAPLSPDAIAHNGTRFVTVGSGAFEASTDARVWTPTSTLTSADDVAWNGQTFVAVGSSFWVHTSPDGLTWTMRSLPGGNSADLVAVAASPSTWVAVGEAGAIFSSTDAIAWTARTSGTTNNLVDVTWATDRFVAVGVDGTVVTSPNGVNWTLQAQASTDSFTAVGASPTLIVGATFPYSGSQLRLLASSDGGATWTTAAIDLAAFNEIVYAGGRFVAVGFYETATSIDGVVWTSSAQVPSLIQSVVYAGNQYVAVGSDGNSVGTVLTSPDGLDWTIVQSAHSIRRLARSDADGRLVGAGLSHIARRSSDDGATWSFAQLGPTVNDNYLFLDLAWSPSAAAFVAHVQVAANQFAYTSTDGASWTRRGSMPCNGALAASPTRLVNVGFSIVGSCVSVSNDGNTWTATAAPSTNSMAGVFWTGSQFVGVGSNGLIATSPDGIAWTLRTSGVSATLNGGTASGSAIVVVGASGTIVTSADGGVSWTPRSSTTTATLRHAVFTGSEFYAVGSGGILLRSATGESWSRQQTQYNVDFGDVLWVAGASRLVLGGARGLVATSP